MAAGQASEGLLNSLLPTSVAERLKRGENVADYYEDATVLFADLVDFTRFEVEGFLAQLLDGNGFWDVTPATLDTISELIAAKFNFTVAEAAE